MIKLVSVTFDISVRFECVGESVSKFLFICIRFCEICMRNKYDGFL